MAAERSTIDVDIQSATGCNINSEQSTTTGYGPRYAPRGNLLIKTNKLVKIPFGKDDIFVDFKTQLIAALDVRVCSSILSLQLLVVSTKHMYVWVL